QLSDGLQAIGAGILRGAGDTTFPLASNLVGHWLVGLPIALYLGFHRNMGIVGLWWGLCAGLTAVAILLLFRFNRLSKSAIIPIHRGAQRLGTRASRPLAQVAGSVQVLRARRPRSQVARGGAPQQSSRPLCA